MSSCIHNEFDIVASHIKVKNVNNFSAAQSHCRSGYSNEIVSGKSEVAESQRKNTTAAAAAKKQHIMKDRYCHYADKTKQNPILIFRTNVLSVCVCELIRKKGEKSVLMTHFCVLSNQISKQRAFFLSLHSLQCVCSSLSFCH